MATKAEKQQEMFSMIESWKSSGQSQHEFCKSRGLAYSGFHYWYKKYRHKKNAEESSPFVAVHIPPAPPNSPVAELILPDGRRLNFYQNIEASFLRALLS